MKTKAQETDSLRCTGFPPVACADARVLILGSLPGVESLRQQQYYAMPHNSFWRIMGHLVGASRELPYETRLQKLVVHRLALWDVCASAVREGSLDSNIQAPVVNDFAGFFAAHKHIRLICCNGQCALRLFRKSAIPTLAQEFQSLPVVALPSTSPAHASLRFEDKLVQWERVLMPYAGPHTQDLS